MRPAFAGPAVLLGGFAAVLLVVLAGMTGRADLHLLLAFRGSGDGGALVSAAARLTRLGAASVRGPVALLGAVILLAARRWRPALVVATTWVGQSLLVEALKAMIDRPRPDVALRLANIADASFPSAHAAGAMALYPLLGLLLGGLAGRRGGRAGAAAGIALALLIGLTRLVLGVHWPSDVVAGWLLGGAIGWAAAAGATAQNAGQVRS